ncbi:MAG: 3-oxoacyl-ACP reductase FabG [Gammaproteobacteria bacterium]|nr:3-oxoacyl-ACP reductase FabG [Gammaproteobacteria bacterium]MBU6508773.1 3-oxoacyl-ACP reductase FabG [Gammaproteobacteria bacterium]MDE1983223.1 3-oxoacyl-ACP reductase FabG [Gammaproteobacteria bacterium]MDE2108716.1 3-oxoacyl-ACP reductase FabG [Gammaproteobacteria bacterium]MDE2459776.1 3-oxoacyl-ACP reductase FabG [Gammaproteobacteria bacterium]
MNTSKCVLVTGASGGIGGAIAQALAADGFQLSLHYHRNKAKAEQLAQAIVAAGGTAQCVSFDVSEREITRRVLQAEVEKHGAYWGVVCNAGITADNTFAAMPGEDWDRVLAANLDSFYNVLQPLVLPLVRMRNGGRIVSIASVAGLMGNRGQTNYSAAKAGLIGASKALAVELASRGITVNCVAPGLIETDMLHGAPVAEILKQIPLGRLGQPREVAALVAFLFSDAAAYITRQLIAVNGGML